MGGASDSGKVFYALPSITDLEVKYATDAARNGWGERCYEYISRFEEAFRSYLDVQYAVATSSGTGALHLGMAGMGIGPGDEVILGDINWAASAAPIVHLGAKPILVDVLPDSWCLDPSAVARAVTGRTKAILAVHLYGNLCEMEALLEIANARGIVVIEDAAEALGSARSGIRAGSQGFFGAFSFHGTKTITTGEGGIFVTNDADLYESVLTLSNHGRGRGETRQFWPSCVGYKYKMSNIGAALGCAQMERLADLIAGKRRVFEYYQEGLEDYRVKMNPEPHGTINSYWMPTVVAESREFDRDEVLSRMRRENIDARSFFWPLSKTPAFECRVDNPVSYSLHPRALNLPSYYDLTDTQMDRVLRIVQSCLP